MNFAARSSVRIGLSLLAAVALMAAVLPLSGATTGALAAPSKLHVSTLRVNTVDDPIGIGDPTPILSWRLSGVHGSGPGSQQSAFQIRVATSVKKLKTPDMWDSGQVVSGNSGNVTYAGAPLQPRQSLVWDVRVWDGNGDVSDWSPPGTWEMGLLTNADWSAKWIEDPDYTYATNGVPNPLPIFGKAFTVGKKVDKARLHMTGLGQYAAKLNGKPVGDAVLEPGQTSYFAEVNYRTYDVSHLLRTGSNVLGIETGSGAYQRVRTAGRYFFQNNPAPVYGAPKVIAQLEVTYDDGSTQTVATDGSWLTELGPTTFSAWWAGEDYDARRIATDWTKSADNLTGPDWRQATLVTLSDSTTPKDTTPLVADPRPPVTVAETVKPVSITSVIVPGGNTTLVAPAGIGDTNVKVASVTSFAVGDTIDVDTGGSPETGTITAVGTAAGAATTLVVPAAAGDTNVKVGSINGFTVGQQILVDTGSSLESRAISSVGTAAGPATTVFAPSAAGDSNIKVGSVSGFAVGQQAVIDTGASVETPTVSAIGTAGTATTLSAATVAGATNIRVGSVNNLAVGDSLTVDTGANLETVTITTVGTSGANGTGVDVTPALAIAHASGAAVRDQSKPGTGITFSAPLTSAHAMGAPARGSIGTGVTFAPALSAGHVAGTSVRGEGTGITFTPALTAPHAFGATVTGTKPPTWVLDFGANLSGLPKVTISGPGGMKVSMVPAETLNANGTASVGSTGASATSQILYQYTLSGQGKETWHSQFTYNGFRYLQVSGMPSAPTPDMITLLVTYASNRHSASFDNSSPLLNSIYEITQRALEGNMESVLTDCPDREKGPYTGDNLHNIDTELTLFDMQAYEGQLVNNMRTAQRPVPANGQFPGLIANIAPEYHFVPPSGGGTWFLDEPNWGGAVIMIPWNLYQVYGDTKAMAANYGAMVKWLDWEATTKAANGGNIRGLGDWSAVQATTAQAVIDYGYYRGVSTMAKIAQLLGKSADAGTYSALAASLKTEYNTKYLHTDASGNAWYANNTEASNAVALDAGLVPDQYHEAVVNSLVAAVAAFGNRIGTGSVAIGPLFRMLHAAGRDDVLYQIVTNPATPGYAFLVNTGHTTLSEALSGTGSQNHHFLGQVNSWFVHGLAGIGQAPGSIGYRQLLIKPAVVGDLASASASYTTPAGEVTSEWKRVKKGISLKVSVPDNVAATVSLPTTATTQSYHVSGNGDAEFVGIQDGREIWTVGAGQTHFESK